MHQQRDHQHEQLGWLLQPVETCPVCLAEGSASALAWILFVIILFFTLLTFRSSSLWVYYEGQVKQ